MRGSIFYWTKSFQDTWKSVWLKSVFLSSRKKWCNKKITSTSAAQYSGINMATATYMEFLSQPLRWHDWEKYKIVTRTLTFSLNLHLSVKLLGNLAKVNYNRFN